MIPGKRPPMIAFLPNAMGPVTDKSVPTNAQWAECTEVDYGKSTYLAAQIPRTGAAPALFTQSEGPDKPRRQS